ncbi:MAG: RsmE family RNA methyltransferase, partial [Owenweeksia sp.]
RAVLGKEESHHATRVLRLSPGTEVLVTRGQGIIYYAEIRQLSKADALLDVKGVYSEETRHNYLHIAIGPTKSLDRFEFFLEKATELGIDEITPLISFHSERKVYKSERGRKIIKAGAKQSLSNWLPKLNEPANFTDILDATANQRFIAHCDDTRERSEILSSISQYQNSLMLIGPEGDFSTAEIEQASQKGFTEVHLGHKRLRTETAGIAVAMAGKLFK